jgi:hypothetical protein
MKKARRRAGRIVAERSSITPRQGTRRITTDEIMKLTRG